MNSGQHGVLLDVSLADRQEGSGATILATIGQIGYTYDNNRNMLADGTREFRYNYLNQLRRVWRKSDGEVDGLVSEYAEDAFGRRVLERSWWELSRRVYFDTRFDLDIELDANSSSTDMELIDGGMASSSSSQQTAEWHTRIYRDTDWQLGGIKYYDYLVEVPEAEDEHDYLGFVGVKDVFELRIFGGYYKLWRNDTSEYTGTYNAPGGSTAGFRNIGFTHARDVAAFIDGVGTGLEILWAANPAKPMATFGSLAAGTNDTSLKLLENLNYLRGFLRGECTGGGVPRSGGGGYPVGGPNPPDYPTDPCDTDQPVFDAMQKSAVVELILVPDGEEWTLETQLVVDYQGSPDRAERFDATGSYTDLYLVSTSRRTAVVVRDGMDAMMQGEEGLDVDSGLEEEPTFGVAYRVMHGAGGTPTYYARLSPDDTSHPDERDPDGADPTFDQKCQPQGRNPGTSDDPAPVPDWPTSNPVTTIIEDVNEVRAAGDASSLQGNEPCACNGEDVTQPHNAFSGTDIYTGMQHDLIGGDQFNQHDGTETAGGGKEDDVPDNTPDHDDFKEVRDAFRQTFDQVVNDMLGEDKQKLKRRESFMERGNKDIHQYNTKTRHGTDDGKTRQYNKYDETILAAIHDTLLVLGLDETYSDADMIKLANLIKAISWEESAVGYGSGWRLKTDEYGRKQGEWIDTEDCMQVANPHDTPGEGGNAPKDPRTGETIRGLQSKVWEMIDRGTISKEAASRLGADWKYVPKECTYKNISGANSFFYGILWFLHKLKMGGVDLTKGLPGDDALKQALIDYNGDPDGKYEYAKRVWQLFETGKWTKRGHTKTVWSKGD